MWFARDNDDNIVTVNDLGENNKSDTYYCPICGSGLKLKAIDSNLVTPHFAHVDASKCNSETMIHWWFKHKFLEVGDKFTILSDVEKDYICKEILVEEPQETSFGTYKPDMTIITRSDEKIYFEFNYSNKKKVKDYLDTWLELKDTVVEVDIKQLMLEESIPKFKALFYEGKCFNTKRNDTYYNTIGKYKEQKLSGKVDNALKRRIEKLDWFWDDLIRYKKGNVDIEYMVGVIDAIDDKEDTKMLHKLFEKSICSSIYNDYVKFKNDLYVEKMGNFAKDIEKKYNKLIRIEYSTNIYGSRSFRIESKLENRETKIIGGISGGTEINADEDIRYILDSIEKEKERVREINKQLKIISNKYFMSVIENINNQYRKNKEKYSIEIESNERCGNDSYSVHVVLKFGLQKVFSIDVTKNKLFESQHSDLISDYILESIEGYRNRLNTLVSIPDLDNVLINNQNMFKNVVGNIKDGSFRTGLYYKDESIARIYFDKPENVGTVGLSFTVKNGNVSIYKSGIGRQSMTYEYNNYKELNEIIERELSLFLSQIIRKCMICKDSFTMHFDELEFYNKKCFNLPKSCTKCKKEKSRNNNK